MIYLIGIIMNLIFTFLPIIIIVLVCSYASKNNQEYKSRYANNNSINNKYTISKEEKEKMFGKDNCHIEDENRFGDKDIFDDSPIQDGKKFFLHKNKIKRL